MNSLSQLKERLATALETLVDDPAELLDMVRQSQEPKFGDYQANFAMPLGKRLGRPPREVAQEVIDQLDVAGLCEPPEIAGPGFINFRLTDDYITQAVNTAVHDERLGVTVVE
ncbi:MAG: arginine--tRNA ligase, partial [Planctomycetia bacterium]